MTPRSVLIVSPHFPPSTLAGVHRARHMAKHLPAHGWRPVVVCVDESFHTEALDPALGRLVPSSVEIVKTTALPADLTRKLGVGDIGLRGYGALRRALADLIPRERPDAVFITGSPFYPLLMAGWIERTFKIPVVLDFQDPWVSAWGARQKPFTKVWAAHRLARWLEPFALRHAAFVTSVSDTQNAQMAARYPWLDAERMAAIPIGGDPQDYDALRTDPPAEAQAPLDPQRLELSYVGAFLPRAAPLARVLFRALADLRARDPALAARLRLNFVGSSNQPNDRTTYRVAPLAAEAGVSDLVREVPQRVPFLQALNLLANSHGVLMIGSDEAHYTASKIYPGMMSGRPFLSLFHAQSSSHAILSAAGGGIALAFADQDELEALQPRLTDALETLARNPDSLGKVDEAAYAPFEAKAVAGAFAAVFERVRRAGRVD